MNDDLKALVARLREVARWDRVMRHNPQRAADCDAAADLIDSMAQRVPLTDERVEAAFADDSHESFADFLSGVRFAEQAHGIRSEE